MKKRLSVIFLTCSILVGLSACGGEEEVISTVSLQGKVSESQVYYATDLKLDVAPEVTDVDFTAYGPSIYYPEGQTIETYSTADRKTTVDTYTWTGAPGNWAFEKICYNNSGELYSLVSVGKSGAEAGKPYLCKFDAERKLVFAKDLAEYYREAGEVYSAGSTGLEVGTDGRAYISNSKGLWIFEADGSYEAEVSFGNMKDIAVLDFVGDAYRDLYVLYEDKANQVQYVAEINVEEGAVTGIQQTIGLTNLDATENGLLAYNDAIVYGYDRVSCALVELFHWSECDVKGTSVYGVYPLADGSFFVAGALQGGTRNYLVKSLVIQAVEGSQTGKTDIVIAMGSSRTSDLLAFAVSRFNKNNEKYNVILEDYYSESPLAGEARLNGELAAGMGPDLIDLSIGDVEELVENEYLEDLALYLEESDAISEGDFLETALETYQINGMQTAIPQKFSLTGMVGHSDYVGDMTGWTLEEAVDFLEQQAGQPIFASQLTRGYFFLYMFYFNESSFVDRSTGTCDFDNDLFRRLAELAEEYPVMYTQEEYDARPSEYTKLQNGSAILSWTPLHEFQALQVYDAALGGNMTCIGFPDEERKGVVAYYSDAFAIASNSHNKQGAWEFLEYYLQLVGAGSSPFFPTYRPSLQVLAERAMESGDDHMIGYGRDRWQYMKHASTREEIDEVMAQVEAARPQDNEGWTVINIIVAELEDYYAGEITLDEAIANIEREVELELATE